MINDAHPSNREAPMYLRRKQFETNEKKDDNATIYKFRTTNQEKYADDLNIIYDSNIDTIGLKIGCKCDRCSTLQRACGNMLEGSIMLSHGHWSVKHIYRIHGRFSGRWCLYSCHILYFIISQSSGYYSRLVETCKSLHCRLFRCFKLFRHWKN